MTVFHTEIRDGTLVVTLDRPPLNALSFPSKVRVPSGKTSNGLSSRSTLSKASMTASAASLPSFFSSVIWSALYPLPT